MFDIKERETVRIGPNQEIVVGHLQAFDKEYATIRTRRPGKGDSAGVIFNRDRLRDVIEALQRLDSFLGPGECVPGNGQGKLFE